MATQRGRAEPLLNLHALAPRPVAFGLAAVAAATATYFALLFTLALYLQQGLGRSPLVSGLTLGLVGRRLRPGRADRAPCAGAPAPPLIAPAGCLRLGRRLRRAERQPVRGRALSKSFLVVLLGAGGLGLGLQFSALVGHLTNAVAPRYAPDISGVSTTVMQIGGALGAAGFGTLYVDRPAAARPPRSRSSPPDWPPCRCSRSRPRAWQRVARRALGWGMAQQHLDRLTAIDASFLAQEGATSHMHIGALLIFEGPPPAYDDFARPHPRRACTWSRATARSSRSRRSRPGGRCGSTTRASTSSTTSATPRCPTPGSEEQLLLPRGADLLPAARPLQAAVGDVARPGPRGQPLRADLQDAPRAGRRRLGRRPRDRPVRLSPVPQPVDARRRAVGARSPSRAAPSWSPRGVRGLVRAAVQARRRRASSAARHPERDARAARARPPRASARSCGRCSTRRPRRR